jgi:hypothetical protein
MKRIFEAQHLAEAHLVQHQLERAGLRSEIRGETIPFPGDSIAGFGSNAQSVWVHDADYAEAEQVLREVFADETDPPQPG